MTDEKKTRNRFQGTPKEKLIHYLEGHKLQVDAFNAKMKAYGLPGVTDYTGGALKVAKTLAADFEPEAQKRAGRAPAEVFVAGELAYLTVKSRDSFAGIFGKDVGAAFKVESVADKMIACSLGKTRVIFNASQISHSVPG